MILTKSALTTALRKAHSKANNRAYWSGNECEVDYLMDFIIEEVERIDEDIQDTEE